MLEISRTALFGKLNPLAYKAIEGATVFCKLRGNAYVELTLAADQVPEPRLGRAVRLGVSAWIGRRDDAQRGRDRNDLRLRPDTSFLLRRHTGVRHA